MGKFTKLHSIESAIWAAVVFIFFIYSFEFDKDIEIYKFGAAGWPRAVLGMLALVMIGNIWHQVRHGSQAQVGRVGVTDDDMADVDRSFQSLATIVAFLLLPLIYAWLLKPVGFYSATPFFIAAITLLLGERRFKRVVVTTAFIYGLLIGLFLMVLNAPLPQGTVSPFYDFSAFMLRTSNQLQNMF